jgi:hypothetical protein
MGKNRKNKGSNAPAAQTNDNATPVETTPATAVEPTNETTIQTASDGGSSDNGNGATTANDGGSQPSGENKPKKVPMSRVFINGVISRIDATVESVSTYVKGFMSLPVGARKGYDNYWAKEDGFTNPESIMKLTPQGIGKMIAVCQHRAALYISEGGEKGTEMAAVLEGLRKYESVAVAEAAAVAKNKLISQARETLKATGMAEHLIDAALASLAPNAVKATVAPATVENSAPTLEESGDGIADAEDAPADEETANA